MKNKFWKRILPLFLSIVMLFSVFAAAIPTASAIEVAAPSAGGADDDTYYRVVFEDGLLRIQLNPQKVYDLLRDGSLSKDDLLNFVPEDVLDTLAQGRDLSLEDLRLLASKYVSASDLKKLKDILPMEVLQEHFDLAMLEELITVEELLSVISIDDLLSGVSDAEVSALITPAALELLLNEKAKDTVLTDAYVESLLNENDVLDAILADDALRAELVALIDDTVANQLLANPTIKANLLALMEKSSTLDSLLADTAAKTALKNYFNGKKSTVASFLTDADVLEALKDMPSVHDSLVTDEVIDRLISANAIHKGNIRTIFSDAQLESLIDDTVLEKLLATNGFVSGFLGDDELVNTIFTNTFLAELQTQGLLDPAYAGDRTQLQSMLLTNADARALVSDEIHHHPEISLSHYWEHVDFAALVDAIGIHAIQQFVDTHDDVYENILHTIGGAQIAEALGEDVCTQILQDHLAEILPKVGMTKLFAYFNNEEIVSALGGYAAIIEKNYVNDADVVTAIGGYSVLVDYLALDKVIDVIGYDRLLDFVDFNDLVAAAGGYDTVLAWYSPAELQAILNAIGTDSLKSFLTNSGISQSIDFRQVTSDLLALIRSKGPQYKQFIQQVVDKVLLFLNTEVASIHINDTQIYRSGRFDFEAITVSILQAIPDVDDFLAMNAGDVLAQWIFRANIRGEEYRVGIVVEFIGDFTQLQELAEAHADDFRIDISDDFDIVSEVAIPAVGSEIYKKVLLSSRVSDDLKQKILSAPTLPVSELSTLLTALGDDELQQIADTVSEKINPIREKAYAKLEEKLGTHAEKLATAKAKVDRILDTFTKVDSLKKLRDKAVSLFEEKLPASLASKTLSALYEGNQSFRLTGDFSADLYDKGIQLLQKLGLSEETAVNMLLYFGNSLAVDGTFDTKLTFKGVYQLSIKDSLEQTHIFYLPEGIDVSIVKDLFPSIDITIPDGFVMPPADTTLSDPDVWWQVDFYADDVLVGSVHYLKGADALDPAEIPEVPAKLGYSGAWGSYTLNTQEIVRVDAIYTKVAFSTVISHEGLTEDYLLEYSQSDRTLELPIPTLAGRVFDTWYIDADGNGAINEGDIRLERVTLFALLRAAQETGTFALPDGYVLPAENHLALIPAFDVTYYEITFEDFDGNPIAGVTLSYSSLTFDKAALTAQFPALSLPNYTIEWYVGTTPWNEYDLSLGGNITVTAKKMPITYTAIFQAPGQAPYETTYTMDAPTLTPPPIPTPPAGYETDGEWYVVSVNGVALATPVKLDEYTVSGGNLEIQAFYTLITYTATFYDENGGVLAERFFTVEDTALSGIPSVPTKEHYTGVWESYTLGAGNLDIHPIYTAIPYTAIFQAPGQAPYETTYTMDAPMLTPPPIPTPPAGYETDGEWYVVSVDGVALATPVKLDEYTVSGGNLEIQAFYTLITYTATFYDENGGVLAECFFTVEDTALSGIPSVPTKEHYTGAWESYTLGAGNLDIHPIYTAIPYTATFTANGATHHTLTYTVENPSLDLTAVPAVPGITDVVWYVISVDGVAMTPTKLSEYTLTHGNLVLEARYALVEYKVNFVVNGSTILSDSYTIEDMTITTPSIPSSFPDKLGYTKDWYVVSVNGVALTSPIKWSEYTVTTGDLVIEALYTVVFYTATFWADGVAIGTTTFTIEDTVLSNIPEIPEKAGYTAAWEAYVLGAENIDIHAIYTAITYEVIFRAEGQPDQFASYTVENPSFLIPAVPDKLGYVGVWYVISVDGETLSTPVKLDEYTVTTGDLVIEAQYTLKNYTASFFDADGNPLGSAEFTLNGFVTALPSMPAAPFGYHGVWYVTAVGGTELATPTRLSAYEFTAKEIDVKLSYVISVYTATFWADGEIIGTTTFTFRDTELSNIPEIPEKAGYTAAWESYSLVLSNLDIHVIYTPIEYEVIFRADGQPDQFASYTVEAPDFTVPLVPDKLGYENGTWYVVSVGGVALETPIKLSEYTVTMGNLLIEARYTPITYTATFWADGVAIGSTTFTVEDTALSNIPEIPAKAGYTAAWEAYVIGAENLDIHAIYSTITYEVIFRADGQPDQTSSYTVEAPSFTVPTLPAPPAGYLDDGAWYVISVDGVALAAPIKLSEYTVTTGDLVIEARYTSYIYTATFYDENGNKIGEADFTVEGFLEALPTVPAKPGYTGAWSYTLQPGDMDVHPVYTLIDYEVIFVGKDGAEISSTTYSVENRIFPIPPIPDLTSIGYENGVWYVVSVDGVALATPVKLDEYTVTMGNLEIEARYTPITYQATIYDENGNKIGEVDFTVEGFLENLPPVPEKPGYTGAWDYELLPENIIIRPVYTLIHYNVTFVGSDGSLVGTTTYTVEDSEIAAQPIPNAPLGYTNGAWYVVKVNGVLLAEPVKLSEYMLSMGDLEIEAKYELKIYKAYFRVNGVVVQTIDFTIETEELSGIREIPAKRGYSAKWSDYTLGLEDLYIDAIYTIIQYTANFEDENGNLMGSVNFTVNDTSIKAPSVPEKAGHRGAWYVVAVAGTKINPVLLSNYSLPAADMTVQVMYEAFSPSAPQPSTPDAPSSEDKGGFTWLWWIVIILIIIIIILLVLLILKKKRLPPFHRLGVTPPAIIAAAIPEVEPVVELPVVEPIVTVDSVDVETADELMSDAVAMAVVETVEIAGGVGARVILNLHVINDNFAAGDTIDLDALKAKKLVSDKAGRLKILADGTLDKPLTVIADSFSVQAIKMITLTGGHAIQTKAKR